MGRNPTTLLYSDTTKCENVLTKKGYENVKLTKLLRANKGYANISSVDILTSFNPELELKNTESAIKNKLKDLLTKLGEFKFVMHWFQSLKKQKVMMEQNKATQKQKQF